MANIITVYQSQTILINKVPIIHCEKDKSEIHAISINKHLAEKLIGISPRRRSLKIAKILSGILSMLPENVVIKDFDVLFNPDYDIDLLKILINIRREKSFEVIWPSVYDDEKLVYSEKEYKDYKVFSLSEYDITCIV